MKGTIIRPKSHDEWLAHRTQGIGSSEVGTILGLNPFETPYQLWRRKKGFDPPKAENFAMKAGHYLEDAVSRFYADETHRDIIKRSAGDWIIYDPAMPYLRVSPDRLFWVDPTARKNEDNKGILECKTTQLTIDADNLPLHWFAQLQYQLGVAGYREGALAWLTMGREFGHKDIIFDEQFYTYLADQVTEYWERYIVGTEEPPAYNVDDVVVKYARHTDGKFIKANADVVAAAVRLKEVKQQIAELTQQKESAEATIKMAIGDAEGVQGDDGKVIATWKAGKDKAVFDTKRFAADHPEEYAEYITQKAAARTFLLK